VPSIGEQVLIACPNGDPASGIILGSLYCEEYPAPADSETITQFLFNDGALLDYDTETHSLRAILPDGATAEITATGGMTLNGDVTIAGDVSVSGDVSADGDVTAGAISLQMHLHGGVSTGSGVTGLPQ
jgi:phage baseplate assembly protein V